MRWWGLLAAAALTVSATLGPVRAQEPMETDRPDFTEGARVVPAGRVQLEGGYTFGRLDRDEEQAVGELLLRAGTGARTELRVNLGSYARLRGPGGRASGFEDVALGFKVELRDASREFGLGLPDVALLAETTLPTGASAFRENETQPVAKLCLAWGLSPRVSLASNLNIAYSSEGGERYAEPSGSVAVGCALTDRTSAFLELFGFAPSGRTRPNNSYVDGGFTYLVNGDYQLDARAGVGLNGRSQDYFAGVGASRRW